MIKTQTILKQLTSPTKIVIMCWILSKKEVTVSLLVEAMHSNRTNVSKQINEMKNAGLLTVREEGRNNFYSLTRDIHDEQIKMLKSLINSYHYIDENNKEHAFYK